MKPKVFGKNSIWRKLPIGTVCKICHKCEIWYMHLVNLRFLIIWPWYNKCWMDFGFIQASIIKYWVFPISAFIYFNYGRDKIFVTTEKWISSIFAFIVFPWYCFLFLLLFFLSFFSVRLKSQLNQRRPLESTPWVALQPLNHRPHHVQLHQQQ